jgi:protein-L-isoaspartate(D-aspartate) O-methyltransferase
MNIEQARFNMIEQQIRPWNVLDLAILDLLSVVKREAYVPAAYKDLAFADIEIPLGQGQCMLAPRLEARMVQDLAIKPSDTVLEIGTGSGYTAALLAHRARSVITVEIDPSLAAMARNNLSRAGVHNVEVRQADGAKKNAVEGNFDVIVLSGSVAEVPHSLLDQLNDGGRFISIVGDEPIMRASIIERTGSTFTTRQPWDCNAPRLLNFAEPSRFAF